MRRKILIPTERVIEQCRIAAVGCLKEATNRNVYDVPMCQFCYKIWLSLYYEEHDFKPTQRPENDDFYCGS
jgi:hypothetical protein